MITRAWGRLAQAWRSAGIMARNRAKAPRSEIECLDLVEESQNRVAEIGRHAYYISDYRPCEHRYWTHIPRWMKEFSAQRSIGPVLDVGCAYGTLLLYAQSLGATGMYGLDFIPAFMQPELITQSGMNFAVGNVELEEIPWKERFDMILFTEVLEHLNYQAVPTLTKLRRALTERGRLYLSTPNQADWGKTTKYYPSYDALPRPDESLRGDVVDDHVWHFSKRELTRVLAQAGFKILRLTQARGVCGRHFNVEAAAA